MGDKGQIGEVEIELDGRAYTMRPCFQALAEIEAATGTGIMALVRRFAGKSFGIGDVTAVVTAGLKAAGEPASQEKVGELIFKTGLLKAATPAGEFLWAALGGTRDAPASKTGGEAGDQDGAGEGALS